MLIINSKFTKSFLSNSIFLKYHIDNVIKTKPKIAFNFCNSVNKPQNNTHSSANSDLNESNNFEKILEKDNFCVSKNSLLTEPQNETESETNNTSNLNNINISKTITQTNPFSLEKQNSTAEIELINLAENASNSPVLTLKNKILIRDFKSIKKELSELSKFKLCVLNTSVALSSYAFYSGISHTTLDFMLFGSGTLFISMTTQVLNQIIEKKYDKQMIRTHMRPLPRERITEKEAWIISALFWSTSSLLYWATAPHAIFFANGILLLYILGYTPLKRHSNLSMHIGAVVGALPALLGSYAATGLLGLESSLLLAAYIMAWQYPHFYGILYQNKDDYKRAGFKFISRDSAKNYIAYLQMIVAMGAMLYIAYRLYKNSILNDVTMLLFCGFFVVNMVPVLQFINGPTAVAKKIRMKSYMPFLIVLISFFYKAGVKRAEAINKSKKKINL
jgi:protoheme IX farnesyltransferase